MALERIPRQRGQADLGAEARGRWLAKLRGLHGSPENDSLECYRCGGSFPRRELIEIAELPGYRWPRYCPDCAEEVRAAHTRRCVLCGAAYLSRLPGEPDSLCPGCHSADRLRELARVKVQLARASELALPATLTLGEWLATLDHFGRQCAYCRTSPFSDLDHFIPLAAGGGTTADNCVPACAACNNFKRATEPEDLPPELAPAAALAELAAYLASRRG